MALSVLCKKVNNEEEEELNQDEEDLVLQQDEEWLHDQKNMGRTFNLPKFLKCSKTSFGRSPVLQPGFQLQVFFYIYIDILANPRLWYEITCLV